MQEQQVEVTTLLPPDPAPHGPAGRHMQDEEERPGSPAALQFIGSKYVSVRDLVEGR